MILYNTNMQARTRKANLMYTYLSPENETRILDNGILVQRWRILSTQFVVYRAYERMSDMGSHQTIQDTDGVWYGTLYSRRDDGAYAHLKGGSVARIAAVHAQYAKNAAEAYDAIVAAFPESADGTRTHGDIEMYFGE